MVLPQQISWLPWSDPQRSMIEVELVMTLTGLLPINVKIQQDFVKGDGAMNEGGLTFRFAVQQRPLRFG
jgi:hypothetical protein